MKTWFILLALYSNPTDKPSLIIMPGSFSAAECAKVKQMFDRDHAAGIGADTDHMVGLFGEVKCIKRRDHQVLTPHPRRAPETLM